MSLQYLSLTLENPQNSHTLLQKVEDELCLHGTPIRWAIAKVEASQVTVEAVVRPSAH